MKRLVAIAAVVLGTVPVVGATAGTVEAYTAWNRGTVTHSYPAAAGSASLSSTVLGCGMKVAIKCSPPQTGLLLGNLAYTGQTSSRNCPAGSLVNYRCHQLGTNW